MELTINGKERDFSSPLTVAQLLEQLQLDPERVVVELNRRILAPDTLTEAVLNPGDSLELVQFVGGG
jgi:thiamine biosynthesis protein ThiS